VFPTSSEARTASKSSGEDSALEILNKRYAGGEITKEQYDEMKKDISAK
jgi:uncharacterized membrane protein